MASLRTILRYAAARLSGRSLVLHSMRSDAPDWRAQATAYEQHLERTVITEFAMAVEALMTDAVCQARYAALHGVAWTPAPWTEGHAETLALVKGEASGAMVDTQAPTAGARPINPHHE